MTHALPPAGPAWPPLSTMDRMAVNLTRLLARQGLSIDQLSRRSGLDRRTIRALLRGSVARPHAETLRRLSVGLGVSVDELFQNPAAWSHRVFDRQTNPLVDQVLTEQPTWFEGWTSADFDELYSRFGTGGGLTRNGVAAQVEQHNRKRQVRQQVELLLESSVAPLLSDLVELLFRRMSIASQDDLVAATGFAATTPSSGDLECNTDPNRSLHAHHARPRPQSAFADSGRPGQPGLHQQV